MASGDSPEAPHQAHRRRGAGQSRPSLDVALPVADFWDRVRAWQASGWTIGMHGFQHRYVTAKAGIVGLSARSEFAGLPRDEQTQKIRASLEIFRSRDVTPDVWIVPGHSFDEVWTF